MRRFISLFTLVAILSSSMVLGAAAQDASPVSEEASLLADLGYPTLEVTSDGASHDLPAELEAGRYHVILNNESDVDVDLEFYQLPEGFTVDDLITLFDEAFSGPVWEPPDEFFDITFNGGATSFAGETGEVVLDLAPGEWVVNVFSYDPETDATTNIPTTIIVTGEMPVVEDPAGAIDVVMAEMYFEASEEIVAGPQIWNVSNEGLQQHHLILSAVPDGTSEEQVMDLANSFFAPPATPGASPVAAASPAAPALTFEDLQDVFYSVVISGGHFNMYALDLAPGTYAMICFLPAPDGTPHVMLGMIEIITID